MERRETDWFGTWIIQGDSSRILIEESPQWIKKQKENEENSNRELSQEEIVKQDIEIIAEAVAINTEDSLATAETLAFALEEIMLLKEEIAKLKGGQ